MIATGIATPTAILVVVLSFFGGLVAGSAVLEGPIGAAVTDEDVDVDEEEEEEDELVDEVDEVEVDGIKFNGIWATTVAAGAIRKMSVAVLQHSNDPIPFPPGSQQLIAG